MSKITKALEKAARERLQMTQAQPTAPAQPVTVPLAPVPFTISRISEIASAGQVHIDPHIVSATNAMSPIAEQYRILRTNFQSLSLRSGSKVIVVTSAVNGEGKSVTATNLALTMARQENLKVVLVDADMRKSTVPKWLGLPERHHEGLSTVLNRDGILNGSLVKLQAPPLAVLPAGPAAEHPAELLGSINMKRLLAALRAQFDLVIVDAPPLLPVADPGIIATQADGVMLVVRAGKTQRKTVLQAQELLKKMKANLLGCVLTHVEYYIPGYYRYYRYAREKVTSEKSDANGSTQGPKRQATNDQYST